MGSFTPPCPSTVMFLPGHRHRVKEVADYRTDIFETTSQNKIFLFRLIFFRHFVKETHLCNLYVDLLKFSCLRSHFQIQSLSGKPSVLTFWESTGSDIYLGSLVATIFSISSYQRNDEQIFICSITIILEYNILIHLDRGKRVSGTK